MARTIEDETEAILHEWYCTCQGEYDNLSSQAIDALYAAIYSGLLRVGVE